MPLDISYHYRDEPDTVFDPPDRTYVKLLSDPRLVYAVFGDDDDHGFRLTDTFVKDPPDQTVSGKNLPRVNESVYPLLGAQLSSEIMHESVRILACVAH